MREAATMEAAVARAAAAAVAAAAAAAAARAVVAAVAVAVVAVVAVVAAREREKWVAALMAMGEGGVVCWAHLVVTGKLVGVVVAVLATVV